MTKTIKDNKEKGIITKTDEVKHIIVDVTDDNNKTLAWASVDVYSIDGGGEYIHVFSKNGILMLTAPKENVTIEVTHKDNSVLKFVFIDGELKLKKYGL